MELGNCPRCARAFTASELVGFGILRPRTERSGGPWLEYRCPACAHLMRLIPFGDGRYALPGSPPPPIVPPEERRPPWVGTEERPPEEVPAAAGPPFPEAAAPSPVADAEDPPDLAEALALLGCSPTADPHEIERAFRERSRQCHPDKVAHLDADFQALAERKFKRLQQAYELLRS